MVGWCQHKKQPPVQTVVTVTTNGQPVTAVQPVNAVQPMTAVQPVSVAQPAEAEMVKAA